MLQPDERIIVRYFVAEQAAAIIHPSQVVLETGENRGRLLPNEKLRQHPNVQVVRAGQMSIFLTGYSGGGHRFLEGLPAQTAEATSQITLSTWAAGGG